MQVQDHSFTQNNDTGDWLEFDELDKHPGPLHPGPMPGALHTAMDRRGISFECHENYLEALLARHVF